MPVTRCMSLLGVLALTALWVGTSALAQERERLPSGPMTTIDGRRIAQAENCQNAANAACANLCNPQTNKTAEACAVCIQTHRQRCQGQ
jgi:hypothetical protein